uniref:Secreted protein n=1 Tax=Heterorhabditis bacteriophora TaxID=37862 RepID=A0A1I7X381_HETBA
MSFFSAMFTSQFHAWVYLSLADVLDLLSLINCYVAFLVYICTCSRYRQTLLSILPNMSEGFSALPTQQNTIKTPKKIMLIVCDSMILHTGNNRCCIHSSQWTADTEPGMSSLNRLNSAFEMWMRCENESTISMPPSQCLFFTKESESYPKDGRMS